MSYLNVSNLRRGSAATRGWPPGQHKKTKNARADFINTIGQCRKLDARQLVADRRDHAMLTGIPALPATRALARGAQPYRADLIRFCLIFMPSAPALAALSPVLAAEAAATIAPSGLRITVARRIDDVSQKRSRLQDGSWRGAKFSVRPEIEGLRISQVLVETGDRVTEGQVLAGLSRGENSRPAPFRCHHQGPAAGVISYRAAQVHVAATVRGKPLFRLIVGGEVELQAEVPARRLSKLAPGQSASVEISGGGEISRTRAQRVLRRDPTNQMGSARIFLGEQGLPIGAFAKAVVVVGESCRWVPGHGCSRSRRGDGQ